MIGYDKEKGEHMVIYDNDDSNVIYKENLKTSTWVIWDGTDDSFQDDPRLSVRTLPSRSAKENSSIERFTFGDRPMINTLNMNNRKEKGQGYHNHIIIQQLILIIILLTRHQLWKNDVFRNGY
jgi:hypothetical protein